MAFIALRKALSVIYIDLFIHQARLVALKQRIIFHILIGVFSSLILRPKPISQSFTEIFRNKITVHFNDEKNQCFIQIRLFLFPIKIFFFLCINRQFGKRWGVWPPVKNPYANFQAGPPPPPRCQSYLHL